MKRIELSDDAFAALQSLAATRHLTPAEFVAALVGPPSSLLGGDQLLVYLESEEFGALPDSSVRYLALLSWVGRNHAGDFSDFISHQSSGRRYLMLSREEVQAVRLHNEAVPIAGSPYWAVMSIDAATKRRFVARLLEFIGCHEATIAQSLRALGLPPGDVLAGGPASLRAVG
jgi:negative modulator of initiation of replication